MFECAMVASFSEGDRRMKHTRYVEHALFEVSWCILRQLGRHASQIILEGNYSSLQRIDILFFHPSIKTLIMTTLSFVFVVTQSFV